MLKEVKYQAILLESIKRMLSQTEKELAVSYVRRELCSSCPDQKCLTGSICRAFMMLLRAVYVNIVAEKSKGN